jgi:hypothetical protein
MSEPMHDDPQFPEAELARVADGSLTPEREAQLRREVAGDPELSTALAGQERAVALLRALDVAAPAALRSEVARQLREAARPRPRRRQLRIRLALPTAATVAVAAVIAIVLLTGGGTNAPSLQQTVHLTLAAAVSPAPAEHGTQALDISASGIRFPYWQRTVGWRALGARTDRLGGRTVVTVFYRSHSGSRVGYAIVGGAPLPIGPGRMVTRGGVPYWLLREGATDLVTWRRAGHTCVIAGHGVGPETLLRLATADVAT